METDEEVQARVNRFYYKYFLSIEREKTDGLNKEIGNLKDKHMQKVAGLNIYANDIIKEKDKKIKKLETELEGAVSILTELTDTNTYEIYYRSEEMADRMSDFLHKVKANKEES